MKKLFGTVLALLLTAGLMAGCAGKSENSAVAMDSAPAAPAPQPAYEEYGLVEEPAEAEKAGYNGGESTSVGEPSDADTSDAYGGRKVIRTEHVELNTDDFDTHYEKLVSQAKSLGGYVENASVSGTKPEAYGDSGRHASLALRIPNDKVDAYLAIVTDCGEVIYTNGSAEDITAQYFDIETRLEVLNTQLERLKSILTESQTLADIIELEREISRVTLEIEQLTTEQRRYDGLVDFSRVYIEIQENRLSSGPAAAKTFGERVGEQFTDTLSGVGTFFVNFAVFMLGASPVLVLLGLVALAVVLIIRAANKHGAKKRAEACKTAQGAAANPPETSAKNNNGNGGYYEKK